MKEKIKNKIEDKFVIDKKYKKEIEKEDEGRKPKKLEKLSAGELQKRMAALEDAMQKIIDDAAAFQPNKKEKKALKKLVKKGAKAEAKDWPLDDVVTPENYKERLAKYGVAQYIEPNLIEEDKAVYAVVNNQYKKYQKDLGGRKEKPENKRVEVEYELEAEGAKEEKVDETDTKIKNVRDDLMQIETEEDWYKREEEGKKLFEEHEKEKKAKKKPGFFARLFGKK